MASQGKQDIVVMEGVRLIFRNFEGKEGQYNREGDRNFGVVIPPDIAEAMLKDGWNVKYLKPREEDEGEEETETPWLPVKVGFGKGRPPQIFLVTDEGRKQNRMQEDTVGDLDWADIINVDLVVRPYHYDVRGSQGISAYVQSLYVTIEEDPLMKKYAQKAEEAKQYGDQQTP